MISDKIAQFIHRWLFETSLEKGPLRKVELLHIMRDPSGSHAITDWPMKTEDPSAVQIPTLVAQILETAQDDANGWGGVQSYVIAGYFGTDGNDGGRTIVFPMNSERRSPDEPGERGLMPTEPATDRGLAATATRHSEQLHKLLVTGFGGMIEALARANQSKDLMIEKMFNKHLETVVQTEQLLDHSAERALAMKREEIKTKNLDRMMDTILPLLPSMVNKVIGFRLLPEDSTPEMEQIRLLLGSLSESQLTKIMEAFQEGSPAQALAFMGMWERMKKVTEEKAKNGEQPKQLPDIAKA